MSKWQDLLKQLSINPDNLSQQDISKLEVWYFQNISEEPLYGSVSGNDKKFNKLQLGIKGFLESVSDISFEDHSKTYDHLDGMNAIQYASINGYDLFLSNILAKDNTHVNNPTKAQLTPLHLAAFYGHYFSVQTLLKYGALTDSKSRLQQTPAYLAVSLPPTLNAKANPRLIDRKANILQALLNKGQSNVLTVDTSGNTIAHLAAQNGLSSILDLLVNKYPTVLTHQNFNSHTALHIALLNHHDNCVDILVKHKPILTLVDVNRRLPIHYAAMYAFPNTLEKIAKDQDLNVGDSELKTALMHAAQLGNLDNVMALMSSGADMNKTDQYGKSAFHYAVLSRNLPLIQWMIKNIRDLDVNQQDKNNRTALMNLLCETQDNQTDVTDIVGCLLEEQPRTYHLQK